jgi:transcriptional regulator with XRE-family HTH domain
MLTTQAPPPADARARLAANLRRLRIARHRSLSKLASETSMSKATISAIESASGNPTLETLSTLAGALNATLAELLEEPPLAEIEIVRAADPRPSQPATADERSLRAESIPTGNLEVLELTLPPHSLHELEPRPAGSRDAVYVLQGKLIAGPSERISELGGGDYASFPTDAPHLYETHHASASALVLRHTPA